MIASSERPVTAQESFLHALFDGSAGVVFIGTLDREITGDNRWTDTGFQYPSEASQAAQHAIQADLLGMDVYVAAQLYQTKQGGRRKTNVKVCPVAWADLDTAHPDRVKPEPSIVVETSPNRFHGYWRTPEPMAPADAEALSRKIAYAHHAEGADLGGWDLTQVLRIPGTHNHKYADTPEVTVWLFNPTPIPLTAFSVLPEPPEPARPEMDPIDDSAPPIALHGYELELWDARVVPDRSAWAMHMVATLKEHGLSDRIVELALANHPIYLDKAREKWGNRESVIVDDIRRCLHLWKNRTGPVWDWGNYSPQNSTQNGTDSSAVTSEYPQNSTQWSYPIIPMGQYIAQAPEDDEPLVDGLIWSSRVHWAFSSPGSGKTLLLIGASMHIAAGLPFCGRDVKQGGVLLLEEDSPQSVIADYARTLFDIYGIDPDTIPLWINERRGLRITDQVWLARAIVAVQSCPTQPSLVVLDTCERVVPSEAFNSKELAPLAEFLTWCQDRGIAVMVIDHTRKTPPIAKKEDAPKLDPVDLLYGGRSKSGVADIMIYFSGSYQTGLRGEFCKFRGEAPPPIDVKFTTDNGFSILDRPVKNLTENEQKITKWLNNHGHGDWHPARLLAEATGINERTIERVLRSLISKRWIVKRGETKGAEYRLNTSAPGVLG